MLDACKYCCGNSEERGAEEMAQKGRGKNWAGGPGWWGFRRLGKKGGMFSEERAALEDMQMCAC